MELCACPECGSPAEVINAECLTVAATLMESASSRWSAPSTPYGGPAPAIGAALPAGPGYPERPEIVGVRCIRRHWFLGLRDRLVDGR